MKAIGIEDADLDQCVRDAQQERIVITQGGSPVAIIVGVEGLDADQVQLGASDRFWQLVTQRRKEQAISRADLEHRIGKR